MADCCSPTFLFVLIRSVHYIACLTLLACWAFDQIVLPPAAPAIRHRWKMIESRCTLVLLPIIALSGGAWFIQLCVNMSGLSLHDAMQPETLTLVWNETTFGRAWRVRTAIWIASVLVSFLLFLNLRSRIRNVLAWLMVILSGGMVSSLAWAGHGQEGGRWHLMADALHLFIAGLWPMGLAPFALFFWQTRKLPWHQRGPTIVSTTFRFSAMSLLSVLLLTLTGLTNGLFMIHSPRELLATSYGRVLLAKVGLFLFMLLIGGFNLLRLKPRLLKSKAEASAGILRLNVTVELLIGLLVLVVTATLGLMMPGA